MKIKPKYLIEREYRYKKSMRENTGWHLFGIFNQGRSQTEQYALELEDVLKKAYRRRK